MSKLEYEPWGGQKIEDVLMTTLALAECANEPCTLICNGLRIVARPGETLDTLSKRYWRAYKRRKTIP